MGTKVPNPVDKYVGSRVRMRRQMLGMSQGKLANKLRLTLQQVQKYEKGTNRISASRYPPRGRCMNGPLGIVVRADSQIAACAA